MENSELLFPLMVGIASSLIATTILVLLSEFARRVILPWIGDMLYRGVRVDGSWHCTNMTVKNEALSLYVKQVGEKITGSAFAAIGNLEVAYDLSGLIRNGYFATTATPKDSKMIDAVTLLLHVDFEGGILKMKGASLCKTDTSNVNAIQNLEFTQNVQVATSR